MAARYGHLIKKWAVPAVAALAALAAMLFIQPAWGQEAPPSLSNAQTVFDYDEKGTGSITTYRARDPENKPVFWTLGGADAADFTIIGGTLRFKSPPDYEVPTDRHDDTNNDGDVDAGEDPASNNVYKVTVRFGAGGEDGMGGDDAYDGDDLGEIDLTVNVTNVNEPGMVVISPMQPQVGTMLTAILTDEDNIAPGVGEWQWARSDSMAGTFTDIPALSDEMTYRSTIDDLGKYLRVTVVYVDRAGAVPRTVQEVSAYPVRKDVNTSNQDPKFPDQSTLIGGDSPTAGEPTDGRTNTDRFIPETAVAGDRVGAPVTAFDDKSDIEVITYSLRDAEDPLADSDTNPDTPMHNDGHAASFNIDEVTGQITVSAKAILNADGTPSATDPNPYIVVVRAVDGDGDTQDITVNIGVLRAGEPPTIDRVYATGRVPTGVDGVDVGSRVPTEMTHYELDRDNAPATTIDTNLDTLRTAVLEPAAYWATDPDDGDDIKWSLDGDDAGSFIFEPTEDRPTSEKELDELRKATGAMVTLAFRTGPDFEKPGDKNKDNVYEVTIVVTDSTGNTDELDVTVKVINSTDDNKPGTVKFSNRQPEVATALTATFKDEDIPTREVMWQWYRAQAATNTGECTGRTPADDAHRGFIADTSEATVGGEQVEQLTIGGSVWTKIAGATSASYTPEANDEGDLTDVGRCLRATVTYRDAVDRTHSMADVEGTDVDETLEGTFAGAEHPVKDIDEENDAPEFQDADGNPTSTYRDDVQENGAATPIMVGKTPDTLAAADPQEGEDDSANDLLTYVLSGKDKDSFELIGTVDMPTPENAADDGTLTFKGGANYEEQREYRVRITATDPSGDTDFVDVIVDVTNVNERPAFTMGKGTVMYAENGTADVGTYRAKDPEKSGITYSLVMDPITADQTAGIAGVDADAIADRARFEIGSITGKLSFKASPDYEDPGDAGDNNMYQVTVKAEVSDNTNPRHFATQEVTVVVTDVNEAPVFSKTTDTLTISENPDDPEKEPPLAAGYLYLLNRGVGKPTATLPAAPNLDVGIPVVAVDDDNNGPDITPAITEISTARQLIDGLTYELSGADAGYFHIVPATGQILTLKKLDYEAKNEFKVTVKATDPEGLDDTIALTINVTNVDEVPVPDILRITGDESYTYEENGMDALGEYTVAVGGDATPGAWTLEGDDAGSFTLEGSGTTRMLKFRSSPDYDAMADADSDNMYEVILKVTDSSESDIFGTFAVTVTVTDVDELGTLSGSETANINEGSTDSLNTYTLTAIEDGPAVTWSLDGADMSDFMLDGTGMTRMLKFTSAPDYESPMGGADADSNTYMVTVMAEAGGEMEMVEVTVMVTDVDELGALSGSDTASINEGDTDLGTYTLTAIEDGPTVTWSLDGADMSDFMLEGTGMSRMLKFTSAPDYETPMGGANDDSNTYMVTVMAEAGGEMEMVEVTVTVTGVNEAPMVSGDATPDYAENGTAAVATYTATDPEGDEITWSLAGADMGDFTIEGGVLMFRSAPDYEAKATYTVMVTATDPGEESGSITVTVMVTNVNDNMPMFPAETVNTLSVAENTAAGMDIGAPVAATDDDNDTLTYTLSGTDAASFDIGMSTGQLMTKAALDYETKTTYMVTVTATDPDGASGSTMVTIMVTDANEAPSFPSATATRSVAENTAAGMNVGAPVMATDDDNDTLSYMLSGDDAMYFTIDGMGQIKVGANAMLDYETKMSYMVTVTATDPDGASGSTMVTVMVTNVNDNMPMFSAETATRSVAENTAAGMNIGDPVMATDDDNDTLTYMLSGGDAMYFTIDGMGQIMVGANAMLDYETKMSYMVTVTATDPDGASDSIMVTIMVTDVDENSAPMFAAETATRMVAENTAAGMNVGAPVMATDDDNDTLSYMLSGDDAMYFTVDGMGQIMVGANAMLDYEATKNTYMVTVTATDPAGASDSIMVTIMVTDVDENSAPMFAAETATRMVAENTAAGMNVGAPVMATDDDNDTLSYMLSGDDAMYFTVDGMGQIMVGANAMLDYEATKNTYMVTVTATDPDGANDSIMVTIMVTDVDEGDPVDPVDPVDPLVARYDANNNGEIEKSEVITAINDYLFPEGDATISKADVIRLINMYLFPNG